MTFMRMKRLRNPILVTTLLLPLMLQAQPYAHAGGVRAGYSSGLTYKGFFLHRMTAIEADGYYNQHGLNLAALYEMHAEPFRSSRWLGWFGGGIYGGKWDGELSTGVCAIGGIEYTLRKVPLNFGLDWRPMLNIYRELTYDLLDFGVTIRYRFQL
jgi:hypothetical protein